MGKIRVEGFTRTGALTLSTLLTLAACARQETAPQPPAATPPAATSTATAAATAAATPAATSTPAPDSNGGDHPATDNQAVTPSAAASPASAAPTAAKLPGGKWQAGVNYTVLSPAQPTAVGPGKIEVLEVFWLGCPHCYALEPYIRAWKKTKPAYVELVRVPVTWGPVHRAHARLFYTLESLGRDDLVSKAFDAIQQQHQPLIGDSDEESLRAGQAFAAANGVKPEDFARAYNSFSVNSDMQRAEELTQRYHVEGVPLVVVNGKYTTDVGKAGDPQKLIDLINDLVAAEHGG
ncbi:MAG: thiol:disulfide interchange protein DsbA/DsbL [Proteobacteria bacterium]|nr:thiol:disulfide interchange protein DsbA/DsbL [Pseudomonadota bacterium]